MPKNVLLVQSSLPLIISPWHNIIISGSHANILFTAISYLSFLSLSSKRIFLKDSDRKNKYEIAVNKILAWEPEIMILCHGDIIRGKRTLY